jgi:hypothetical protein
VTPIGTTVYTMFNEVTIDTLLDISIFAENKIFKDNFHCKFVYVSRGKNSPEKATLLLV